MNIRTSASLFAVALAASFAALTFASPPQGGNIPVAGQQPAPEFRDIEKWLNSQPLKLEELRG